ncbi:hypothetical protein N7462_009412 [Penicillium macrosclerotiorum]|uniref:uncharacterized protein n=1 Tax=Penicillium macrosclerotiorum TaxID=303699 RepID=UPI0025491D5E|nr:uncharacterized protein N7462_009412 [Penicillium macrosclerotiorum]KAJ5673973.1 hypothetical protein N7462_009412 [Penicillium macrosclerotiorum]
MTTTYAPQTSGNTTTSWLPMTTAFTPSAFCGSMIISEGALLTFYDINLLLYLGSSTASDCLAPAVLSSYTGNSDPYTTYSMGPFTCPGSWSEVATTVKDGSSTQTLCCPSNYQGIVRQNTDNTLSGWCQSVFGNRSSSLVFLDNELITTKSLPAYNTTTFGTAMTITATTIMGWNVKAHTATATSTISTDSTASTASSTSTTGAGTATATPANTSSHGLSTGAKAGVGVGVAAGALALIAFGLFYFFHKRKQRKNSINTEGSANGLTKGAMSKKPVELDGLGRPVEVSGSDHKPLQEMVGCEEPRPELGSNALMELNGDHAVYELEGTDQHHRPTEEEKAPGTGPHPNYI